MHTSTKIREMKVKMPPEINLRGNYCHLMEQIISVIAVNSLPHRIWKSSGVSGPWQAWTRQGTAQKHRKYNQIIVIINWIPHLSVDSLQRWVQLILQVEERRSGRGLFDWVGQSHDAPVISKPLPPLQKSQTLPLHITAFVFYRIIFIEVSI